MADRQTRVIGGNGTSVQAFTLDPGLLQYVQSVFVEVDNSAGGSVQPTLTVKTNNGRALAKKQQGRSIPAGDAGSATWALRLDDELDTALRPGVVFDFLAPGLSPHDAEAKTTFFGWTPDTPNFSNTFTIAMPVIAAIGTVIELQYLNFGTETVLVTFSFRVSNFTTGQTEKIDSTTVSVPPNTVDFVSWDSHSSGSVLVDRTFPQQPNFAVAGNYVIVANGSVGRVA